MKKYSKVILTMIMLVVVCAIGILLVANYFVGQQPQRGVAMEDVAKMYRPGTKELGSVVIKTYREYRGNTIRWSAVYFGCLFGSAFFSAMAALLLKFELLGSRPKLRNDLAATLATGAALLVTLSTTGDFQRKWQANRVAAAGMENLAYELIRPSAEANLNAIVTRIQEINDARNLGIAGELGESGAKKSPALSSPP